MISAIVYGRNDDRGYGMAKRVACSLNALASVLDFGASEIIFVDYNTADHLPTLPELIRDTLTETARRRVRVLRVRPVVHDRYADLTTLPVLEPVARNVALRRSNARNRWILSTNTDSILVPRAGKGLADIVETLPRAVFGLPRFELPERVWEGFDRADPAGMIRAAARWGAEARLDEVVHGAGSVLFDGPGDFQLVPRADLFAMDGFDEDMLFGWHVDHNLAERLTHRLGAPRPFLEHATLYHMGHARQLTATHSRERTENDTARFVAGVKGAELPHQRDAWGCPDDPIEEIDLTRSSVDKLLSACRAVMAPLGAAPLETRFESGSFDSFWYDAGHVVAHLLDLLSPCHERTVFGYVGVRRDTFAMLRRGLAELGFKFRVLIPETFALRLDAVGASDVQIVAEADLIEASDVLLFEFGLMRDETGRPRDTGARVKLLPDEVDALDEVQRMFVAATAAERSRMATGRRGRLFAAVNAHHNRCEQVVGSALDSAATPYSMRLRYGVVTGVEGSGRRLPVAAVIAAELGRDRPIPAAELAEARGLLRSLLSGDGDIHLRRLEIAAKGPIMERLVLHGAAGPEVEAEKATVLERLAAFTRPAPELAAIAVADTPGAARPWTRLASFADWQDPDWVAGTRRFADVNQRGRTVRNGWIWERGQILAALSALFAGRSGARALVVCEYPERLIGALDSIFDKIDMIDVRCLFAGGGPKLVRKSDFGIGLPLRHNSTEAVDALAEGVRYDAIVMPHSSGFIRSVVGLGGILARLRPHLAEGGILALAGEVALGGHGRVARPDRTFGGPAGFPAILERLAGLSLVDGADLAPRLSDAALVGDNGDLGAERPVLGLRRDGEVFWPCVWFFRAGGTAAPAEADLINAFAEGLLGDQVAALHLSEKTARRNGTVVAEPSGRESHVIYGPFLPLPAGRYEARIQVEAARPEGTTGAMRLVAEVGLGQRILRQKDVVLSQRQSRLDMTFDLPFDVDQPSSATSRALPCEVRLWSDGKARLVIGAVRIAKAGQGARP